MNAQALLYGFGIGAPMRRRTVVTYSRSITQLAARHDTLAGLGFRVISATTVRGVRAACRVIPDAVIIGRSVDKSHARQITETAHRLGVKVIALHDGDADHNLAADFHVRAEPGNYRLFSVLLQLTD